jgi:hypothetical protein
VAKLLAEAAALVPEMCGVGDKERLDSPEEPTEFERWELALFTGMLNKRDSAFHRSLKAITQPETLQLALDRIPRTDAHRRTLVEQRMLALTTAATSSASQRKQLTSLNHQPPRHLTTLGRTFLSP